MITLSVYKSNGHTRVKITAIRSLTTLGERHSFYYMLLTTWNLQTLKKLIIMRIFSIDKSELKETYSVASILIWKLQFDPFLHPNKKECRKRNCILLSEFL